MLRIIYIFAVLSILFQVLYADLLPNDDECGLNPNDKLADGIITRINDFPWTVRILQEKGDEKSYILCSGILISKRYVLSNNCVTQAGWTLKSVRLGEFNTTSEIDCEKVSTEEKCADPVVDIPVEEIIPHELYDRKVMAYDISLIRLSKDVEFTEYIRPICIPKTAEDRTNMYDGKELIVTGWGQHYDQAPLDVKLQFKLTGIDNKKCTEIYKKAPKESIKFIGESDMCADAPETFCYDSPSNPLIVLKENNRWMLIGTDSYGVPCNTSVPDRVPTVYALTGYYYDWIVKNMKP